LPSIVNTTDQIGRLPTPIIASPIAPATFAQLAAAWRSASVWLSLWDVEARCAALDEEGPALWTTLWSRAAPFRQRLAQEARRALDRASGDKPSSTSPVFLDANAGLMVLTLPVRMRSRLTGVVLGLFRATPQPEAAAVMQGAPSLFGEDFIRLCDQAGLDVRAISLMAERLAPLPEPELRRMMDLLALTVRQAQTIDTAQVDLAGLTANLQNTYEELHLVYQISGQMSLARRPAETLRSIAQELLDVSRARGVAFVLAGAALSAGRWDAAESREGLSGERIIQVGSSAPALPDLHRLAEILAARRDAGAGHVLLNASRREDDLQWASSWLQHLLVVPLRQENRVLGRLLAVNCKDEGDFTSCDVQLFRAVADRVTTFLENQRLYDDLADLLMGLLHALVSSIDAKDPYTCGHSERVAYISRALARAAGQPPEECERVYLAGLLHDVGKIGVPDAILCKPGRLTPEEFDVLRKHPEIGARILSRVRQVQDLIPGVLYHHERMDGRGYPGGLDATNMPQLARIICLADCFDAMTTSRTYRTALSVDAAVEEIRRCSGTQFDPRLADVFLNLDLSALLHEAREYCGTGWNDAHLQHIGTAVQSSLTATAVAGTNPDQSMAPAAKPASARSTD